MISSWTADSHRNRALLLCVDTFLGKPYDQEELGRRVAELPQRRSVR
jgi:hypothetical protein